MSHAVQPHASPDAQRNKWDNESDEVVIESVTLTYDYFEMGR